MSLEPYNQSRAVRSQAQGEAAARLSAAPSMVATAALPMHIPKPLCASAVKVAFLSNPASYPDHPARVEVIETHHARVFLADTRAYKLKKPMHLRGADWVRRWREAASS